MTKKMIERDFLAHVEILKYNFTDFEIKHSENKFVEFYKSGFKFFIRKDCGEYAVRVPCPRLGGDAYTKQDSLSLKLSQKDIAKIKNIIEELSL